MEATPADLRRSSDGQAHPIDHDLVISIDGDPGVSNDDLLDGIRAGISPSSQYTMVLDLRRPRFIGFIDRRAILRSRPRCEAAQHELIISRESVEVQQLREPSSATEVLPVLPDEAHNLDSGGRGRV
jgi:hypothetical protein